MTTPELPTSRLTGEERELGRLIVETLRRPELAAELVRPDAELSHLGIDSLDQIQIAVSVKERYGVNLDPVESTTTNTFRSLRSLTAFVTARCRANGRQA